ncbi:hypothetical protein [Streptomyces celluloflavus]|uniref:hypothetical protein n=1 Tax=Streptomyces celluloflavus TaxID=58344 RepID=UPI0036C269B7
MPEDNGNSGPTQQIRTGAMSGLMVVGSNNTVHNLRITAEHGSTVTVHRGPLPDPVRRTPVSHLPRSAAEPLTGREQEVRALQEAVGKHQLVQVWGASGIGKSALLRHLARTMPHGPEGAAYIEAGGRTADDIAQAIFDISFDAPDYKPSPEALKEHLKTLRLRVYLDDVGLDEKDLHRLFDMAEQSMFVFTSQQRSAAGVVHPVRLGGLAAPAGTSLVAAVLDRELRSDEARTVEALCDAVDGSPLRLRQIALSAITGKGLPGIADLPGLLPALLNRLRPQERDLLYLLGSLSGAELAARHLNELLALPDTEALADGLVRHGLLVASETGYSCPPDVAGCVLKSRGTVFPAKQLCRTLTAWVEARDTTPDDVAAHSQALDAAVVRAEKSGQAQLGAVLARAASPKLAMSRQFDAWGSLLGAGWSAAKSMKDKEGEEFFLREARTRRQAISRGALTAAATLEAGALWHELTALHAHSAAQQVANAATATVQQTHVISTLPAAGHTSALASPGHALTPVHATGVPTQPIVGHTPLTHPVAPTPPAPAPVHPPVTKPVVDLSNSAPQPHAAANVTGGHSAAPAPQQIDLSQAHHSAAQPAHGLSTTTPATGTGHPAFSALGAKVGVSALATVCSIGFVAVLGVGAAVYMTDQQSSSSSAVSSGPAGASGPAGNMSSGDNTSPAVDPACLTALSELAPEITQHNTDVSAMNDAFDSYNSAMRSYNSGASATPPDDSAVFSEVDAVISDLNSTESTLEGAVSQAQGSSVQSDLESMLTGAQQAEKELQSFKDDPKGAGFDTSGEADSMNSALAGLKTDCGG